MARTDLLTDPVSRKLRVFAFDPSVSARFDFAAIGEITIAVPWEQLQPGPVGEYIEVVDADPASGVFYPPVDLNDPRILAQDGLAPLESNPQFHQQMVYAVAMATIGQFERALGRVALWSTHRVTETGKRKWVKQFVRRLRICPHALRERNAYYSPEKKALLFGYFPVNIKDQSNTPGTIVFTCLSHDIVAHETTHALLDGVHPRFHEAVNQDVLAFHEAFADVVALFQHFSYPGVLRDQIARTRGDLAGENLLAQLAQQFGLATGRGQALRDALGAVDPATGRWARTRADPHALERTHEPHERGAILVAAIFGAFLKVYRGRTLDLYRIATDGRGVLPPGDIHPDLATRLADEAAACAGQTLQMCIRAIDFCPPVGITFGDYLRGIVTADVDLNPVDASGFRLAFVESFLQWGIAPEGLLSMSVESLQWPSLFEIMESDYAAPGSNTQHPIFRAVRDLMTTPQWSRWDLETNRYDTWVGMDQNGEALWNWLMDRDSDAFAAAIGLVLKGGEAPPTVFRSHTTRGKKGVPNIAMEVHSVRQAVRRSPRGAPTKDLVVEITQRRRGYFDPAMQQKMDKPGNVLKSGEKYDSVYRAGCTLLINPSTMQIRRVIRTPGNIADNVQLEKMRQFLVSGVQESADAFHTAADCQHARVAEPFAFLHRSGEE